MGKKNFKRKINPNEEQTKLYDRVTNIETIIINKITQLKKFKNSFNLCDHLHKPDTSNDYDPTLNYYDRFWKQYTMNLVFIKKMHQLEQHVRSIEHSVADIQKKFAERQNILELPALAKVKKSISKSLKLSLNSSKEEENHLNLDNSLPNNIVPLKKEEEVEPQLINFHSSENQIFQND